MEKICDWPSCLSKEGKENLARRVEHMMLDSTVELTTEEDPQIKCGCIRTSYCVGEV